MAYFSYPIFDMRNEFSAVPKSKRLVQQFLVDTYCKVENVRHSYLRQNQTRLRTVDYTSLREYLGYTAAAVDEG